MAKDMIPVTLGSYHGEYVGALLGSRLEADAERKGYIYLVTSS